MTFCRVRRENALTSFVLLSVCIGTFSGCAISPPPAAVPATVQPMTLPRYLGVDGVASGFRRVVYRSRLRMSTYLPILEPLPAAAIPAAIGDPACARSCGSRSRSTSRSRSARENQSARLSCDHKLLSQSPSRRSDFSRNGRSLRWSSNCGGASHSGWKPKLR
jgi:hypothetical protein